MLFLRVPFNFHLVYSAKVNLKGAGFCTANMFLIFSVILTHVLYFFLHLTFHTFLSNSHSLRTFHAHFPRARM